MPWTEDQIVISPTNPDPILTIWRKDLIVASPTKFWRLQLSDLGIDTWVEFIP
jgi:hypothetical protein